MNIPFNASRNILRIFRQSRRQAHSSSILSAYPKITYRSRMISCQTDLVESQFSSFFYLNSSELRSIILISREFQSLNVNFSCYFLYGVLIVDLINYFTLFYFESNMRLSLVSRFVCWLSIINAHAEQTLCISATYYNYKWQSFEFRRNELDVLHLCTIHEFLNSSKTLEIFPIIRSLELNNTLNFLVKCTLCSDLVITNRISCFFSF